MQSELRLKKRQDFRKVYNYGKSFANRELVVFVRDNAQIDNFRLGISVSKKIGNAVVRNRVKRLIKENVRLLIRDNHLKNHIDLVIIARSQTAKMDFSLFSRSLFDLFRKANLLNK